MTKTYAIILGIIIVSFAIGAYFYPYLPERMASHWNIRGDVDDTMSRFWGAFLMPIISVGLLALFIVIPKIDPKRGNIERFRGSFNAFLIALFGFLFYLYVLTILWNIGYAFSLPRFLAPAFAVLWWVAGRLIGVAEQNWTIGIRTPWTMSSESVWKQTHVVGGRLFKIAAILSCVGIIFPAYALWFVMVPVLASALGAVVYSYVLYRRERR